MEIFAEKLAQLKMTYKCQKDTITMFWGGEFKEEKVIEKIKENFGSIKQFTLNFVQKGLEIKISKKDLAENYHNIMKIRNNQKNTKNINKLKKQRIGTRGILWSYQDACCYFCLYMS